MGRGSLCLFFADDAQIMLGGLLEVRELQVDLGRKARILVALPRVDKHLGGRDEAGECRQCV